MPVVDQGQNFLFAVEQERLPFASQPNLDFAPSLPARRVVTSHAFVPHHVLLLVEGEGNVIKRIAIIDGNPALPKRDASAIVRFHREHFGRFHVVRGADERSHEKHRDSRRRKSLHTYKHFVPTNDWMREQMSAISTKHSAPTG